MAILMTEQLAKQLIEHYEQCIKEVKQCTTVYSAQDVCYKHTTDVGFCYCASKVFDVDIYSCEWVKSFKPEKNSWYIAITAEDCLTIPDIIDALQTRVDILKTFKNENQ